MPLLVVLKYTANETTCATQLATEKQHGASTTCAAATFEHASALAGQELRAPRPHPARPEPNQASRGLTHTQVTRRRHTHLDDVAEPGPKHLHTMEFAAWPQMWWYALRGNGARWKTATSTRITPPDPATPTRTTPPDPGNTADDPPRTDLQMNKYSFARVVFPSAGGFFNIPFAHWMCLCQTHYRLEDTLHFHAASL